MVSGPGSRLSVCAHTQSCHLESASRRSLPDETADRFRRRKKTLRRIAVSRSCHSTSASAAETRSTWNVCTFDQDAAVRKMAYLLNLGTRELEIRIALGASQRNILSLVVRQGMAISPA